MSMKIYSQYQPAASWNIIFLNYSLLGVNARIKSYRLIIMSSATALKKKHIWANNILNGIWSNT